MIAARKNPALKNYTVAGKSLADIDKDIKKKGPVDPNEGKRYAGSCLCTVSLSISDSDVALEITPESSPVEARAQLAEGKGSVTSIPTITLPKLASDKGLTDEAKQEWKRFVGATRLHEDGHASSLYRMVVDIAGTIAGMSATATGANEKEAKKAALKALYGKISESYGGSTLADMVNADIKAYDAKTSHGASEGAVLKTSIT